MTAIKVGQFMGSEEGETGWKETLIPTMMMGQ